MIIELVDPQGVILSEIADTRLKRDDIALTYAMCLTHRQRDSLDWMAINHAIIARWSLAGLKYVKTKAWRRVEEKAAVGA